MLMKFVRNLSVWPDTGVKAVILVQIIHFDGIRVIFLENLKTAISHECD